MKKEMLLQLLRKFLRGREPSQGQLLDRSSYQLMIKPLKQAEVYNDMHVYITHKLAYNINQSSEKDTLPQNT